jgi:predicted MPP superfamily phosphohydrolase
MLTAVGVYLWWRLVLGTTRPHSAARRIGNVVAVVIALLGPMALIAQYALPIPAQRVIAWPGWLSYAAVIFLATATVLTEPVRIWWWWQRRKQVAAIPVPAVAVAQPDHSTQPAAADHLPPPAARQGHLLPPTAQPAPHPEHPRPDSASLDRRLFLQRVLAVGIGGTAALATGIAARSAVGGPAVRTATIAVPGIPPEAVGMRIALVSDLHLGSVLGRDFCRSVVDLVNAQNPDVVLLVGDLTDGSVAELAEDLRPLADLRSAEGTFFVTGNHEFYFDPDGWLEFIPQLGIRVLANEGVPLRGLLLAGVHDIYGAPSGRGPDMDAALVNRGAGQPVIMMSHSPNLVDDAIVRDVQLMVSGHTHGGQFYPSAWIVAATSRALSGLYSFGSTQVFVTNGAGFWGPIARLGAPPDITMIELIAPGMTVRTES